MSLLFGLHDRQAAPHVPDGGWCLDVVALSENPQPTDYTALRAGINWIVRLQWGFGTTGNIPEPQHLDRMATAAAAYVHNSRGANIFIIGNEPNHEQERPNGIYITPRHYATCFLACRVAIKQAKLDAQVIPAPCAPYHANPVNWLDYWSDMLGLIAAGGGCDGIAIHAYTRSSNPEDITSTAKMGPPLQDQFSGFWTYMDALGAVPDSMVDLPAYITEFNELLNDGWHDANTGVVQAAYADIDDRSSSEDASPKIHALILYRWPKFDKWHIEGKQGVIDDFRAAVARGYTSPQPAAQGQPPQETHLPTVSIAKIDPRLTDRGVKVHEVQSSDPNQLVWRIVKAQFFNQNDSQGRHHIYVESLDESGNPVNGIPFLIRSQGSPQQELKTNGRIFFDATNVPMWASEGKNGYSIQFWEGDTITGLGMGEDTPGGFNAGVHTSTVVTAQQRKAGGTAAPAPQPPAPPVTPAQPPYVPTPSEVLPKSLQGTVTATLLNVRSGPAADYPIVRQLAQGATVTVTARAGRATSVWLQMGKGEWIYEKYIALQDGPVVPPDDGPTPVEPPTGDNWNRAWPIVLSIEGGLSTDRNDKGNYRPDGTFVGTKYGISALSHPTLDIVNLTKEQALEIYHRDYWLGSGCDKLPWPLALLHFDAYVQNQNAAKKFLAVSNGNPILYMAARIDWYTTADTWDSHGRGWMRRCATMLREVAK